VVYDGGTVPQIDVLQTVRPVFQQDTAALTIERIERRVYRTAELQGTPERPVHAARVPHPHAEVFVKRLLIHMSGTTTQTPNFTDEMEPRNSYDQFAYSTRKWVCSEKYIRKTTPATLHFTSTIQCKIRLSVYLLIERDRVKAKWTCV